MSFVERWRPRWNRWHRRIHRPRWTDRCTSSNSCKSRRPGGSGLSNWAHDSDNNIRRDRVTRQRFSIIGWEVPRYWLSGVVARRLRLPILITNKVIRAYIQRFRYRLPLRSLREGCPVKDRRSSLSANSATDSLPRATICWFTRELTRTRDRTLVTSVGKPFAGRIIWEIIGEFATNAIFHKYRIKNNLVWWRSLQVNLLSSWIWKYEVDLQCTNWMYNDICYVRLYEVWNTCTFSIKFSCRCVINTSYKFLFPATYSSVSLPRSGKFVSASMRIATLARHLAIRQRNIYKYRWRYRRIFLHREQIGFSSSFRADPPIGVAQTSSIVFLRTLTQEHLPSIAVTLISCRQAYLEAERFKRTRS